MFSKPLIKICCWLVLALALMSGVLLLLSHRQNGGGQAVVPVAARILPATNAASARPVAGSNSTVPSALELARRGALLNYPDFQTRPLPVGYESAKTQWTLADGKDTNIIKQLADNPLEYDRMVEENARIFRRQLVYVKETPAAVFEQAKLTGAPVRQLTLPGVDGQELQFDIVKSEGNGSSRQGMFSGHLAGNVDSLVTLAFVDGRVAYTVLSPKDNVFVVGEPREDGQVIVKAIDPNTYGLGPEDAADHVVTALTNK